MIAANDNVRLEYRFMEFLNRLDAFLKEHLDYVFLVLVFLSLAFLIWRLLRRRPPDKPSGPITVVPLTGIFDFMRSPKPSHIREEEPPPLGGPRDDCGSRDDNGDSRSFPT